MFRIKEEEIVNSHTYFRKLESVYFMFISIPLAIFIYTYFTDNKPNELPPEPMNIPQWTLTLVIVTSLVLLFLAYKNFKKQVNRICGTVEGVKVKMSNYYTANVRLYALIELVALFWTVMYWETHINAFAVLFGIHIAFISLQRNTPQRMGNHLRFSKEIYDKIRKGEEL